MSRSPIAVFLSCVWFVLLSSANLVYAVTDETELEDTNQRLDKLEKQLDGRGLLDLLKKIEMLQHEVATMQGRLDLIERDKNQAVKNIAQQPIDASDGTTSQHVGFKELVIPPEVVGQDDKPLTEATLDGEVLENKVVDVAQQNVATPSENLTLPSPSDTTLFDTQSSSEETFIDEPNPNVPEVASQEEHRMYRTAFQLLEQEKYSLSITRFQELLSRYPQGVLSEKAQYWVAENHYLMENYTEALAAYRKTISNFPDGKKHVHALLKIGFCQQRLGQLDAASSSFNAVKNGFPGTVLAKLASTHLSEIEASRNQAKNKKPLEPKDL